MEAKGFLTGAVLILVALLFIVRLIPWIYSYMTDSSGVGPSNSTLSDVPGGNLLDGVIIFLLVLVMGIALVLKVFDLI